MSAQHAHHVDAHELADHVLILRPRRARRSVILALLVGGLVAFQFGAPVEAMDAIRGPVTIQGVATVARPGCAPDAYRLGVAFVDRGGEPWLGTRPLALGIECEGVSYGTTAWYSGAFDPKAGGCLEAADRSSRVCLGAVPTRGVHNGVRFDLCFGATCWRGSASLVRT